MAEPIVTAKKLNIIFNQGAANEFHALKDISCEIYPREYIILFGPSGCGKSTLLYSILGGLPPVSGSMLVKGENIYVYTPQEMVGYQRATVGIIYQAFNLIPSIDVLDNVALPQIFMGVGLTERSTLARQLLRRFGIEAFLEKKLPPMLSGGQQQRVAVARSLINNPEILLADEPVGNLDSVSAGQVMDKLETINSQDRKTVILVTHDAKYLPYAHRVYYMRDGYLRRIVVNPEKPQIKRIAAGETIVTEIEQLARLFPYSEPLELKVKSVVNYLTQGLTFDQIERLEKAILKTLDGKMGREMFYEFLTKPMHAGGIGIMIEEANKIADKMMKLINQSHDVRRFRDETKEDAMFLHQQKFIERLESYLIGEYALKFSSKQKKVFKEAIAERISGLIGKNEFEQKLCLPDNLGGVALEERVGSATTRYLEKLIAQGGYIIREKE